MWSILKSVFQIIVMPIAIPWLHNKVLITEADKARADLIKIVATEAAEMALARWPERPASSLADYVVDQIADSIPTNNRQVAYRAAWAAVRRAVAASQLGEGQTQPATD